ncbi:uncharacterized protein CTRU02_206340 [Colletotrichum truncatum]|uniref:Uncharacterized protein n=1 Tax=Colletotrichum truncatum TaxID=5467 RepID=A0ACC3Z6J8_COLTU|nr:uncharacterized protein CTRU02_09824 [Colletotrichum truncatum]KAF6788011.1 hypothetical protein CTRU02_09824 [Colletotrichum truncatum]
MTDTFPTLTTTPKRKRDDEEPHPSPIHTTAQFSFQLPEAKSDEDGSASPRSKVVHKFRGLALGGGGGVAQQQSNSQQRQGPYDPTRDVGDDGLYSDDPFASRKRMKVPELEMKDADAADAAEPAPVPDPDIKSDPELVSTPSVVGPDAAAVDTNDQLITATTATAATADTTTSTQRSLPFLNRIQNSKSAARRRAGTPPLKGRKGKVAADTSTPTEEDGKMEIVDPVRAALTWKEEEITIYDPDDEDDDGTGINGVGFMPTAAMAYARTQKRRLQLAEYKKREESEARARRNQRRRGSGAGLGAKVDSKPAPGSGVRKVRFMESEPNTIVTNG